MRGFGPRNDVLAALTKQRAPPPRLVDAMPDIMKNPETKNEPTIEPLVDG